MNTLNFTSIYNQHAQSLSYIAKKHAVPEQIIDEFIQEAFVKLLKYNKPIGDQKIKGFLVVVIKNMIVDYFRKASTRSETPVGEVTDHLISNRVVQYEPRNIERLELMNALIKEYSGKKGGVEFGMYYGDGLSVAEISKQVNKPECAVRSQIFRFRKKFREVAHTRIEC